MTFNPDNFDKKVLLKNEKSSENNSEKNSSKEDVLEGMKIFPEDVQLIFRRLIELSEEEKSLNAESIQTMNNQFKGMSNDEVSERLANPTEIQKIQSKNEGDYYTTRGIEISNEASYFWEQLGKINFETIDQQRQLADYRRLFTRFLYGKHENEENAYWAFIFYSKEVQIKQTVVISCMNSEGRIRQTVLLIVQGT